MLSELFVGIQILLLLSTSFIKERETNSHHFYLGETGIYHSLDTVNTGFHSAHGFFLLDQHELVVRHYTHQGNLVRTIGGQGQGPGFFDGPARIIVLNNELLVFQHHVVDRFSLAGDHLQRLSIPSDLTRFEKVVDGWVGLTGLDLLNLDKPLQLVWLDDSLDLRQVLYSWPSEEARTERTKADETQMSTNRNRPHQVPLAQPRTRLEVGLEGRFVYVHPSGTSKIVGFNVADKKLAFEFNIDREPYPFNDDYGDRVLDQVQQMFKTKGIQRQIEGVRPSHFPIVQFVSMSPTNRLIVELWQPYPTDNRREKFAPDDPHFFVIDSKGQRFKPSLVDFYSLRIIAVEDETAFVSAVDHESETCTIIGVPFEQLETFIRTNPLDL